MLGAWIRVNGSSMNEMERRITQMWRAFQARRPLLMNAKVHRRSRLALCEKVLLPVLTYSAGGWNMNQSMDRALDIER